MNADAIAEPLFCTLERCVGGKDPHCHFYDAIYYGNRKEVFRAWEAARVVVDKELRVIAFWTILIHIREQTEDFSLATGSTRLAMVLMEHDTDWSKIRVSGEISSDPGVKALVKYAENDRGQPDADAAIADWTGERPADAD